jgi:hypothetical protein
LKPKQNNNEKALSNSAFFNKNQKKMYKDCSDISIHIFIQMVRSGDMQLLIKNKENQYTEDDLNDRWIDIIDEYNTLINKNSTPTNATKVQYLKAKLKLNNLYLLKECITILGDDHIELKAIAKELKVKIHSLDDFIASAENQLNKLNNEQKEDKEIDPNGMDKMLIILKENGYNLNRYQDPIIENSKKES